MILYLILVLINIVGTSKVKCPEEHVNNVTWSQYVINSAIGFSTPLCFNHQDEIAYRTCLPSGEWEPAIPPTCNIKTEELKRCPFGFHELQIGKSTILCLRVTKPQSFQDGVCYGSDETIFDLKYSEWLALQGYLLSYRNITKFWLPARRARTTYFPVVWKLPGSNWGQEISEEYEETSPRQCISVAVDGRGRKSLEMTNCEEKLNAVCLFKKDLLLKLSCPEKYVALRYMPDQCYGILKEDYQYSELSFKSFQQMRYNNIFKQIVKYFKKRESDLCLAYVFQLHGNRLPIVMKSDGNLIPYQFFTCVIDSIKIRKASKVPKMLLQFYREKETLLLTVYNRDQIWREDDDEDTYGIECFTNADYELIRSAKIKKLIWEDITYQKSLFEVKMYGDGPGYYWCEAHTIHDFEFIRTERVVAMKKQKGHPFAFIHELECGVIQCSRIQKNMKKYGKYMEKLLNNIKEKKHNRNKFRDLIIHNVRAMNIETITPEVSMKFLFHVTVSMRGSAVDNDSDEDDSEEYENEDDNEVRDRDDGIQYEISIRHRLRDLIQEILNILSPAHHISVNSTQFCFAEASQGINKKWQPAAIGITTTTSEICLLRNGLPVSRECLGDFIYGAKWAPFDSKTRCISESQLPRDKILTDDLYNIYNSPTTKSEPVRVLTEIKSLVNRVQRIIPADLYYLGGIMQIIVRSIVGNRPQTEQKSQAMMVSLQSPQPPTTIMTVNETGDIVTIYNYLMEIDTNITKPSARLNSTNILLDAFENFINTLSSQNDTQAFGEQQIHNLVDASNHSGVIYKIEKNIMIFIIDPSVSNVTGVAIFQESIDREKFMKDFTNCTFRFLSSDQAQEDLLMEEDLIMGTYFPQSLIERLDEIKIESNVTTQLPPVGEMIPLRIVIKIFANDRLYQENTNYTDKIASGGVISVTLPGYESNLPELLPIFIRTNENSTNETSDMCRYWNYSTWAEDGLEFLQRSDDVVVCGCSHLTPFAYLVVGSFDLSISSDEVIITKVHQEALDLITVLGCSLSFIGIAGIIITAIMFQSWREKPSSKVLLQLSAAIALQMILFCFVNTEVLTTHLLEHEVYTSCIVLGACLHYSVMVQFAWMLIVAYLQYKRYVQVLGNARPTRFFLKSFFFGWCLPIIPVLLVVFIDREAYIPVEDFDYEKICYPQGKALYFGVILPIGIIIAANLVIFIIIIYNIFRGPDKKVRHIERKIALSQLRLSVLLFFLLGFTWIFGLLASTRAGLVFSYLFCLTATLQGFVIFVYFVVLDPVTRKLWSNFIRRLFCKDYSK